MSKAIKYGELERILYKLPDDRVRQLLEFARKLAKESSSPIDPKRKFWELADAGSSGFRDIGTNKHKYLAEAYHNDR